MFERIRKRDGRVVPFQAEKITRAIYKAAVACGGQDYEPVSFEEPQEASERNE